MSPELVMQSLTWQRTYLHEQIQLMPKGSPERSSAEDRLKQQDDQISRVTEQYKKAGLL